MSVVVPLPVEVPGEDVDNPPFAPIPATSHIKVTDPLPAEFAAPAERAGWAWPADDLGDAA